MTTFNAAGNKIGVSSEGNAPDDEQLVPPDDTDADDGETVTPESIAKLTAGDEDIEKPEPEPGVAVNGVASEVEVIEAEGTTVALDKRFDVTTTGEKWDYDFLEFNGDKLAIRLPTRQALAAFSLASSKYVSLGVKNDLTGLFIARHLSPESYGRVFSRLMDPDESEYTVDTVGELFNAIVTAAIEADKGDDAK